MTPLLFVRSKRASASFATTRTIPSQFVNILPIPTTLVSLQMLGQTPKVVRGAALACARIRGRDLSDGSLATRLPCRIVQIEYVARLFPNNTPPIWSCQVSGSCKWGEVGIGDAHLYAELLGVEFPCCLHQRFPRQRKGTNLCLLMWLESACPPSMAGRQRPLAACFRMCGLTAASRLLKAGSRTAHGTIHRTENRPRNIEVLDRAIRRVLHYDRGEH